MSEIWGLSQPTIEELADEFLAFHHEFAPLFRTTTRDVSEHGLTGLKGSLLMEGRRSYVEVARKLVDPLDDGQNYQHCMSDSPWDSRGVFDTIQAQIRQMPELGGGMLNLDDRGDWGSSTNKAGAQRRYLGRLGKVDVGQVGVIASDSHHGLWAFGDAELFFPESWFRKEQRPRWKRFPIPPAREFASKLEIAQAHVDHAIEQGLPFAVVGMETWYGRDGALRDPIARKGRWSMASVPRDTEVYLEAPQVGIPVKPPGQRGPACRHARVLNGVTPLQVSQVAQQVAFETLEVRDGERGLRRAEYAFVEVWTVREESRQGAEGTSSTGVRPVQELLVIRRDSPRTIS